MHPRSRISFVVFMSCTFTIFAWFRRVNNLHLLLFYLQYPPPVCLVCCIPRVQTIFATFLSLLSPTYLRALPPILGQNLRGTACINSSGPRHLFTWLQTSVCIDFAKKAQACSSTLGKRDRSSSLDERARKWENTGHLQWKLKENPNKPKGDVVVDWYGTLFVENNVPDENKDALFRLQRENYRVHLLSFCGYKRGKDVRSLAQQLHFPFDSINFTRERKGEGGKADWMLWKGHDIIFEDQMDIIEECSEKGIWVYVVAARSNRDCKFPRYQTFGDAVDAFLAYSSP